MNDSYISKENATGLKEQSRRFFAVKVLEIRNSKLILDGLDQFSATGKEYGLIAKDEEGKVIHPEVYPWRLKDKQGHDGESLYQGRRFRFEIPLTKEKRKVNFCICASKDVLYSVKLHYGVYGKLSSKLKNAFYERDGYIIRKEGLYALSITPGGSREVLKSEIALCREMSSEGKTELAVLRMLARLIMLFRKKPLWLIRDNEHRAKDSGAEMFKYYGKAGLKNKADAIFILDKKSEDYRMIRGYGRVISPYGFRYKLAHLTCSVLIDTRGNINAKYVFGDDYRYIADLCDWDYIWIIHGVIARNFAKWFNKFKFNAKLVITTNTREYNSVINDFAGYGYFEREVVLTGLPRHDALYDEIERKVLFLPTWRNDLAGKVIPGTDEREHVENFRETDFARFYNSLINDKRLLESMRENGYTGDFYLHPSFIKQADDFDGNDLIRIGKKPADANELICKCSLLVTDFSSAQFEAAYLGRPVVYSQFDADIYNERHTSDEGYFSWEADGFGPVCHDEKSTVDAIITYLDSGCENEDPYKSRADNFFIFKDHDNSRRVFDEIMKLNY